MNNVKKIAIASAVSAALGGTASVNALTLAEPGGALLVPYALCDTAAGINTMIGIVNAGRVGIKGLAAVDGTTTIVPSADFNTKAPGYAFDDATSTSTGSVHWFFYNHRSSEEASGDFPITKDDFHGFDWCANAIAHDNGPGGALDGQDGYLVFIDNGVLAAPVTVDSNLNLYGDACVLQGNWGACAWDPVLPLRDMADAAATEPSINDEVNYSSGTGFPTVSPINAGIVLGDDATTSPKAHIDVRYFLADLGLGAEAETDMVFWFDQNYDTNNAPSYANLSVDVFDEDEDKDNTSIQLPDELNVIDARDVGWTGAKQTGFIVVNLPESDVAATDDIVGTAVSFSLIWFGPNPNDGVQTVLAHERGLW